MFSRVAVAGTFDVMHAGHEALLKKALSSGRRILIGLCTDKFANSLKGSKVHPYEERKRALLNFLGKQAHRAEIFPISDPFGPALTGKSLEAIVVSTETEGRAEELNGKRKRLGLKPLKIISIPLIYAQDLRKISSRRVKAGKISAKGALLKPVRIAVGSTNPTKLAGVKAIAKKVFPKAEIFGVDADSGVSRQPFANETLGGAINRAMEARKKAGADFGVGLESGIFSFYGRHFDVQWCAIYDGENITLGHSMGFEVPPKVVERLRKGKEDMAQVFEEITGIRGIGKRKGAIGYLSGGITERKFMSEQAFLCAIIPRLNSPAYKKRVINQ